MRFLIAPDSFKGTLSSLETCRIMAEGISVGYPDAQTRALPLSDGGDGTMDALLSVFGGQQVEATVTGPLGSPVTATYAVLTNGTAVIEMASACGARLVEEGANPAKTTTYGVGELLLDAARRGCSKILLGLGSSCTNDGGCGAAAACGVRFLDRYVEPFTPTGSTLEAIESVDVSGLDPLLRDVEIQAICAVSSPLCGMLGTSATFAPAKGALPTVVSQLDAGLAKLGHIVERDLGVDVLHMPCAGAGGGLGAAMAAFFDTVPSLGIEAVLELSGFDALLSEVDCVVTGEGCFDAQSLHGKVVSGVARHCQRAGIPVVAVVGVMDEAVVDAGHALGVTCFAPISPSDLPLSDLVRRPRSRLSTTCARVAEILHGGGELPAYLDPAGGR